MPVKNTEDTQTTNTAFVDPADEIASILIEDEETSESDDSSSEETLTAETTDEEEVNESDEESTEESDTDEESEESEDDSWGEVLGVPEEAVAFDNDGNIAGVNVKINGKASTVSMADMIKDYQSNKSVTEKSQLLATERTQFDEAKQKVEQEYVSKLENVETITNYLSNKLVSEFEGINWDQLRVENPAEYAAARQDYSSRAQELKQAQDAVAQEKEQHNQANTEEMKKAQSKHVKEQFDTLIVNNPTWIDETVRVNALTGLKSFAGNQYGFNDSDFKNIQDARIIELLKDAEAYHKGVKVAAAKRKRKVPKFQRSTNSGTKVKKVTKLDKLTKAVKSAKGTDKRSLQTDAITELLMQG